MGAPGSAQALAESAHGGTQGLLEEAAQLRDRCHTSEAAVEALHKAQDEAAESLRSGMLPCQTTCLLHSKGWHRA